MLGVVMIWVISFTLSNILQCYPLAVNFHDWGFSEDKCIDVNTMLMAQAWSDVATNAAILLVPTRSVQLAPYRQDKRPI